VQAGNPGNPGAEKTWQRNVSENPVKKQKRYMRKESAVKWQKKKTNSAGGERCSREIQNGAVRENAGK